MTSIPKLGTLALAGGVALLSAACTLSIDSGETVTQTFDVEEFDQIEIASAFDATVDVGEATSVEVTVDSEILDRLDIDVVDGRLVVQLSGSLISTSGPLDIVITTPELSGMDIDGAAKVDVDGIAADDFELTVRGAADVEAEGSVETLTLESDGASKTDLADLIVGAATVDIGGASSVDLTAANEVNGEISGASSIDVPDIGTIDIDSSGVSSVNMGG